jgi:hypothetical protein
MARLDGQKTKPLWASDLGLFQKSNRKKETSPLIPIIDGRGGRPDNSRVRGIQLQSVGYI